jgi:ribose transport system ATP-binding protein
MTPGIRTPSPRQAVRLLSGGNQQKVVIAKWLFRDSRVLFFDEPTRGIDIGAKYAIYKLLDELAAQGIGVVFPDRPRGRTSETPSPEICHAGHPAGPEREPPAKATPSSGERSAGPRPCK